MSREREKTLILRNAPESKPPLDSSRRAALVLIHPPGPSLGRRIELPPAGSVLGRLTELEVPIDCDGVSRRHARIGRSEEGWFVEDLDSTNGTFVNDERVQRKGLADGDLLRVGVAILKFLSGSEVESAYHEAIHRMAIYDGLTGAANRRALHEFLDRELSRSLRYEVPLSIVLLDIDHFKRINDEHGHLAGDAVLREIGARLRPRMRKEDLLARYGGEEFVCVLTGTERPGALVFAESLRMMIGAVPFQLADSPLRVTVSLGVASIDGDDHCTVDDLIGRADGRLYEAKRSGRNRTVG